MALAIFEYAHITGRALKCILYGEASRKDGSPRWLSLAIFEFAHIMGRAIECILHGEAIRKDGYKNYRLSDARTRGCQSTMHARSKFIERSIFVIVYLVPITAGQY